MITTLDAVDFIYQVLTQSQLKTAVKGGIYKLNRPMNSTGEDLVINSLPVVNSAVQEGMANVNIHVPNLVINIAGTQDSSQPNTARMKILAEMARASLEDVWIQDAAFRFVIAQESVFDEPENNSHYINFRISYYSVNLPNY